MKRLQLISAACLASLFINSQIAHAQITTVVLQNGVGGYNGCVDADVSNNDWGPNYKGYGADINTGNSNILRLIYEDC